MVVAVLARQAVAGAVVEDGAQAAKVWSRASDQLSWLTCHNRTFERLAGVAAVNRIDNLKTAISPGAGAWGVIHFANRAYAQAVGFQIAACAPRAGNAKGKVEAKVRLSRLRRCRSCPSRSTSR